MRLDYVYIDGYKNLKNVKVDFDPNRLTTVVIGQNGAGKSNLIEAIVLIFRFIDLNEKNEVLGFDFEVEYRIDEQRVRLIGYGNNIQIEVNDSEISKTAFNKEKRTYFPDLIFGYYSGSSDRLERFFDKHQRKYYDDIKNNENDVECLNALNERRLFYVRPIHGVLSLLSFFAFPDKRVIKLLKEKIGILGFHSALSLFHEPWYARGGKSKKLETADDFWGAEGPAAKLAKAIKGVAFQPFSLSGKLIEDYRNQQVDEAQYACFIKDGKSLSDLANNYSDEADMFYALEAADISDLYRHFYLWVERTTDQSGDVSLDDLSDGERQLLMVLGLLRISRGKRALFLLDEPDTHLNPAWQHAYLELIQAWTGRTTDAADCHIILTSHNPLTISSLESEEVRVMYTDENNGAIKVSPPYTDPKGLGFTATLTEIFGFPTTLDPKTQKSIDDRNELASLIKRSDKQELELIRLNDELNRLGFMFESREPLYQEFLRAMQNVKYADRPVLNPEQIKSRQVAMKAILQKLMQKEDA